jgi:hypothetical protein
LRKTIGDCGRAFVGAGIRAVDTEGAVVLSGIRGQVAQSAPAEEAARLFGGRPLSVSGTSALGSIRFSLG